MTERIPEPVGGRSDPPSIAPAPPLVYYHAPTYARTNPVPARPLALDSPLGPSRNSMRILVTGATGFIGRRLVERLTQAGHAVVAVVRPSSTTLPSSAASLTTVRAELSD